MSEEGIGCVGHKVVGCKPAYDTVMMRAAQKKKRAFISVFRCCENEDHLEEKVICCFFSNAFGFVHYETLGMCCMRCKTVLKLQHGKKFRNTQLFSDVVKRNHKTLGIEHISSHDRFNS